MITNQGQIKRSVNKSLPFIAGTSNSSSKPKSKHKKSSPSDSSDKKKHVKFDEKTFTIFDQRKSIDKVHISKKMSATPVTKALHTKTSPLSAKSTSPPTKAHNTFSTKRKIVDKPPEPFKVFLDPSHSMARVVWLYLLECKLPFEKIPISSKLRDKSQILPAYSNHCIFVDGETTLGQVHTSNTWTYETGLHDVFTVDFFGFFLMF